MTFGDAISAKNIQDFIEEAAAVRAPRCVKFGQAKPSMSDQIESESGVGCITSNVAKPGVLIEAMSYFTIVRSEPASDVDSPVAETGH
eukprot:CAMPEP_0185568328 /NCGR_PEP_ID=MMETSP0434-20130131/1322_1 /TAXON_ID=626734 ORGANISM="Favella taraikaensis, Strain Fe Narragansett Bay" /NCGR_SAMPLE_ID=MMETSP0434 /ASSEMBLY_ACC=CAM_ASM_000379 /LENGTH=87 /DNA_ID=CAMNT_0028182813 /DNA_START=403 /DNA_END=666 /DNA_ORIENTATION=+